MPFKSEQQRKAMYAAAAGKSNIGIPKSVGEKFVRHGEDDSGNEYIEEPIIQGIEWGIRNGRQDEEPVAPKAGAGGRAAGILFLTKENEILLMRRGEGGDFPLTFGLPGGHVEPGESLEEAARREALEETGREYKGKLELIHDDGQFATFLAEGIEKFDPTLCDESTGYVWTSADSPPEPLHPGLRTSMRIVMAKTELDVAQLMSEGLMPSPQRYANVWLLAIRITGTGMAYRHKMNEHVWRDPSIYLNDEFLRRCNGLTVIMDHPDGSILDTEEFKDRAVGSVLLPYIKGDEVWGIAKIYDASAMEEIKRGLIPGEEVSTSPSVVFNQDSGNVTLTTESGDPLLIEGVPFLLDHIAIVTKDHGSRGVWDKNGPIEGVLLNNPDEVSEMTEKVTEPKADAQGDMLEVVLSAIQGINARMDSMEKNLPAPELLKAADKKSKKRHDDDEEAACHDDDDDEDDREEMEGKVKVADKKAKRKDDDALKRHKKRHDDDDDDDDDAKGKKRHDDDDEDEEAKKDDDDAEGGEIEGQAGEIKFDDDEEEKADAQAKADSVYAAIGKSAPRAMRGESTMAYRKRLLKGLQAHSDSFKNVNLRKIADANLLNVAEKTIFADAMAFARAGSFVPAGQLMEFHEKDRAGRTITKFKGAVSAWLDAFKVPAQRVTAFHTQNKR